MTIRDMMMTTEGTQVFCVHTVKDSPRITSRITGTLEEIESDSSFSPLLDMQIESWGVVDDMIDVTVILDDQQTPSVRPSDILWFVGHKMKRLPESYILQYIESVAPADDPSEPELMRGFYAGMKMALDRSEALINKGGDNHAG